MITLKISHIRAMPRSSRTSTSSATPDSAKGDHHQSPQTPRRRNSRSGRRSLADKECQNCHASRVSGSKVSASRTGSSQDHAVMWRRDPHSGDTLCNRCGLYVSSDPFRCTSCQMLMIGARTQEASSDQNTGRRACVSSQV